MGRLQQLKPQLIPCTITTSLHVGDGTRPSLTCSERPQTNFADCRNRLQPDPRVETNPWGRSDKTHDANLANAAERDDTHDNPTAPDTCRNIRARGPPKSRPPPETAKRCPSALDSQVGQTHGALQPLSSPTAVLSPTTPEPRATLSVRSLSRPPLGNHRGPSPRTTSSRVSDEPQLNGGHPITEAADRTPQPNRFPTHDRVRPPRRKAGDTHPVLTTAEPSAPPTVTGQQTRGLVSAPREGPPSKERASYTQHRSTSLTPTRSCARTTLRLPSWDAPTHGEAPHHGYDTTPRPRQLQREALRLSEAPLVMPSSKGVPQQRDLGGRVDPWPQHRRCKRRASHPTGKPATRIMRTVIPRPNIAADETHAMTHTTERKPTQENPTRHANKPTEYETNRRHTQPAHSIEHDNRPRNTRRKSNTAAPNKHWGRAGGVCVFPSFWRRATTQKHQPRDTIGDQTEDHQTGNQEQPTSPEVSGP